MTASGSICDLEVEVEGHRAELEKIRSLGLDGMSRVRGRSGLAQVNEKRSDAGEIEPQPIADVPVTKHNLVTGGAADD
jgi:hypothetical protein